MASRLSESVIKSRLKAKGLELIGRYTSVNASTKIRCLTCRHSWSPSLNNTFKDGYGCPKCNRKSRCVSPEEAAQRFLKVGYRLVGPYRGYDKQSKVECVKCETPTKVNLHTVTGCRACHVASTRLTSKEVLSRLKPRKLKLLVPYRGQEYVHRIKCLVCRSEWKTELTTIFAGHGCSVCSHKISAHPLSDDEIQDRLSCLKDRGIKLIGKYNGTQLKSKYRCLVCRHKWASSTVVEKDGKGTGCPRCDYERRAKENQLSENEIRKRLKIIKKREIVLLDKYNPTGHKLKFQCLKCRHKWKATFASVWHNESECPECRPRIWTTEEEVRQVIEKLTRHKFPKTRPVWLRGRHKSSSHPELDGYCEKLRVAFEYNGEQHYHIVSRFKMTEEGLREIKLRDQRKRMNCYNHGVLLITVPYWKKDVETFIRKKLKEGGFRIF